MLLHGTARNVLVIGFGMGVTTGACALYPEAQVTCVELTPEVLEAGPYFERQNHGAVHHPRVSLVVADGRTYVDAIPGSYDVITSDPIHPWVSGSSGLYSADHYKVCRNRLNPGGVFCQWLPLYQLAPEDVAIVVRSFLEAFPDGSLWATEFDGLLIGATDNINIDTVQLNALLDKRRIFDDLDEIGLADPFAICGLLIAGPRQLDPWAASAPLNTENHPIIEFNVPRSAYKITHISNLAMLHALRSDPADRFRDTSITVTGLSNTERELIDWVRGADLQRDGLIALGHHRYNDAEALLRAALAVQPASRETKIKLAEVCFAKGSWMAAHQNPSGARLLYEHGLGLDPTRAQAWNFLGSLRYESGDFPGAEAAWRQALAANPSYVPAAVNLEGFLRAMRQPS